MPCLRRVNSIAEDTAIISMIVSVTIANSGTLGVGEAVGLGFVVGDELVGGDDADVVCVGEAVGVMVGACVGVGLGVAVGEGLGVGVGVEEGVEAIVDVAKGEIKGALSWPFGQYYTEYRRFQCDQLRLQTDILFYNRPNNCSPKYCFHYQTHSSYLRDR